MLKTLFTAAMLAATTGAGFAAEPGDFRTAYVRHADLDLTRSAGQAALRGRIAAAVERVCDPVGKVGLAQAMAANRCRKQARADAGRAADVAIASALERAGQTATRFAAR